MWRPTLARTELLQSKKLITFEAALKKSVAFSVLRSRKNVFGMPVHPMNLRSRRQFLISNAAATMGAFLPSHRMMADYDPASDPAGDDDKALVAVTFALEMSRNYPEWDNLEWDYEKGNLNEATKQYSLEACRQVKAKQGRIHCFAVGRVFEQANIDWLKHIVAEGHPVGNHTYDHVNIHAQNSIAVQARFRRAPWLIAGRSPTEVITENIRLCELAMRARLGIEPAGFLAPGTFDAGIKDRPDVQRMLLSLGYEWAATQYPRIRFEPGRPTADIIDSIVATQAKAQPFVYPSGLIEVSGHPPTDVHAFRTSRWKLDDFLVTIEKHIQWAVENRSMYKLALHPSIMYVEDPEFKTVNLVCDLLNAAGGQAALVDLSTMARRARRRHESPP